MIALKEVYLILLAISLRPSNCAPSNDTSVDSTLDTIVDSTRDTSVDSTLDTSVNSTLDANVNSTPDANVNSTLLQRGAKHVAKTRYKEGNNVRYNTDYLEKVVNFVRHDLSNLSNLAYKEQIEDLNFDIEGISNDGVLYKMKLRLNETHCRIDNSSCDPYFDPVFLPQKENTQIIAPLVPLLSVGKKILVQGLIPMKSEGFHITLQTGYKKPVEGQLRINVKLSPNASDIQLEYFEEAWNLRSHYKGSLAPRQHFQIEIACLAKKFKIYINNKNFASFEHVLPYQDATHLSIFGDVTIHSVTGVGTFLSPKDLTPSQAWLQDTIQYQTPPYVPFVARLATSLVPGKSIFIKGVIPSYSAGFAVTIQSGSDIEPQRAQLRFFAEFPKDGKPNTITLSYFDGIWQNRQVENPVLTPGHAFKIAITCLADYFQVLIDGQQFAKYNHELPFEQATHLSVLGMVNISEIVGIGEVPRIKFLDKPVVSPYEAPLKNVTLTPGRKLRIWAYITKDSGNFSVHLEDKKSTQFFAYLSFLSFRSTGSDFSWNTHTNKADGKAILLKSVGWLNQGQPLQIEISCLENSYKIFFFGLWSAEFEYRLPLNKTEQVDFPDKGLIIYAIDGINSILPPPPPPQPLPMSRVCSMNAWYRPLLDEIWLSHLVCSRSI